MRIGVLDVGSNSAHLKVVDLRAGQAPRTVVSAKQPTRLAEAIDGDGVVDASAVCRLAGAVGQAACAASSAGVDELVAFATSAVRDAANRDRIVERVRAVTGVRLGFLAGVDEARLTFLAARAWYGWSAGRLLLADIGGGSLELACGEGEQPQAALSLPLGAGRLTRRHLPGDPPSRKRVRRLREHVYERVAGAAGGLEYESGVRAVATSKTFFQLARLTGASKVKAGPYAVRVLERDRLRAQIPVLAKLDAKQRAKLRGVSRPRARQILAGAIAAESVMTVLGLERVEVCPWALREGVAIRRSQALLDSVAGVDLADLVQAAPLAPNSAPVSRRSTDRWTRQRRLVSAGPGQAAVAGW